MLISITVENFLSFDNETQLTMIPSSSIRKMKEHKVKVKKLSLLKHAVIYGANAAGKSNLIKIFGFIQNIIRGYFPDNANSMFCKYHESNIERPSRFEIQFTSNGTFYEYGFTTLLKSKQINEEWLLELRSDGTVNTLFEREKGKKPKISNTIILKSADKNKKKTYIEDFDETSNTLFLSFMNNEKKYDDKSKLLFFKDVYIYITQNIKVGKPEESLSSFSSYTNQLSLSKIKDLLSMFDTGICDIFVTETSIEDLKRDIPESIITEILSPKNKILGKNARSMIRSKYHFFDIEHLDNGEIKISTIKLKHNNTHYDFNYKDESDGTRRLIELLDILLTEKDDIVYIIDEIERSMHSKLIIKFIEIFEEMHKDRKIQLIFTTHETSLLNENIFRKDEIWFVERDIDSKSKIYSLNKFNEIHNDILSQSYLEGRYGAIPVFKKFKFKED